MRRNFSLRDFGAGTGVGLVLGLVLGASGLAAAAMGYEGWSKKFSHDFKSGFVAGYVMMADLARNLEPGGYVDQRLPYVAATPLEWVAMMDELYRDPANQGYTVNSMMQAAAHRLEERKGKIPVEERMRLRAQTQLQAVERRKETRAAAGMTKPPSPPKFLQAAPQVAKTPPKPKARKWCRCDGKNPKAERAKRRAAREEAAKKAAGGQAAPASKDSAKQPPEKAKAAGQAAPASKDSAKKPPAPAKP
jgi:hypothetical protein